MSVGLIRLGLRVDAPEDANDDADDDAVVELIQPDVDGSERTVGRRELQMRHPHLEELTHEALTAEERDDDFAVGRAGLSSREDVVAVENGSLDHGIAGHTDPEDARGSHLRRAQHGALDADGVDQELLFDERLVALDEGDDRDGDDVGGRTGDAHLQRVRIDGRGRETKPARCPFVMQEVALAYEGPDVIAHTGRRAEPQGSADSRGWTAGSRVHGPTAG